MDQQLGEGPSNRLRTGEEKNGKRGKPTKGLQVSPLSMDIRPWLFQLLSTDGHSPTPGRVKPFSLGGCTMHALRFLQPPKQLQSSLTLQHTYRHCRASSPSIIQDNPIIPYVCMCVGVGWGGMFLRSTKNNTSMV